MQGLNCAPLCLYLIIPESIVFESKVDCSCILQVFLLLSNSHHFLVPRDRNDFTKDLALWCQGTECGILLKQETYDRSSFQSFSIKLERKAYSVGRAAQNLQPGHVMLMRIFEKRSRNLISLPEVNKIPVDFSGWNQGIAE